MDQTKIEWTDFTVNFWEGCQKVGPGCDHCYAEARDIRFTGGSHWGPGAPRRKVKGGLAKLRKINREGPAFEARHGHYPRVFCSSLSDVFDNAVDPAWRSEAFDAIEAATDTRVQMLTKRVGNVGRFVPDHWRGGRWASHVGLMITVVNQAEADRDIPKLLALKAKFGIPWVGLSVEPMLGPVDLTMIDQDQEVIINCLTGEGGWPVPRHETGITVDWVICGGESGRDARPIHPSWVRSLRDQCDRHGTPFLFKQWGEYRPAQTDAERKEIADGRGFGGSLSENGTFGDPRGTAVVRVGKKVAGRKLDGCEHNGFPDALDPRAAAFRPIAEKLAKAGISPAGQG